MTTLVACLTPPGTAALATLALRGPEAWQLVRGLFRSRSSARELPDAPELHRFWLGTLGDELADEVVVAVTRASPVAWVEVHCHGGLEVIRLLIETFQRQGAQLCSWDNLERRTEPDPARAAAWTALAEARTARTAALLLDQYHGALSRAIAVIRAALEANDSGEAQRLLAKLLPHASVGLHLTRPWQVVIAGAPNVGKSSLINALAGYRRSVVAPTPGTTRDVVTTLVALDGWPVELADTAGLRNDAGDLEEQGIERARTAMAQADLCVWVLDAAAPPTWPDSDRAAVRLVINKIDLPPHWDLCQVSDAVRVSARTGEGIEELVLALARWLVPAPPPPQAPIPFTPTLCRHLEQVRRLCTADQLSEARSVLESIWQ